MNCLHVNGRPVALDQDGFIRDLQQWDREVAQALAQREGIALTEAHWELIALVQAYYREFGLSPAMRPLVKYARVQLGEDKGASLYFLGLFPGSPAKLLSKVAGLPRPDNCL